MAIDLSDLYHPKQYLVSVWRKGQFRPICKFENERMARAQAVKFREKQNRPVRVEILITTTQEIETYYPKGWKDGTSNQG